VRTASLSARLGAVWMGAMALIGCEAFYSDNENFQRQSRAEHARRVAGMRAASAQTPVGTRLEGEGLRALLSGRTHVAVFGVSPSGRRERYVEYRYYAPGGQFVYVNTAWARDPKGNPSDRWRVDGPRLCVLNQAFTADEQCYTIAVTAKGHVQYFIDRPGDDTHGLLTSVISIIQDGAPPPADGIG
jgi:drug/metabolite transporter superfamily protein YnfA